MTRRCPEPPPFQSIQFTARIALQCAAGGARDPERVVCDTIANGSRRSRAGAGPRGGRIYLFEKAFPTVLAGAARTTVSVLAEVTPEGCFALALRPGRNPEKIWSDLGFLNRADPK